MMPIKRRIRKQKEAPITDEKLNSDIIRPIKRKVRKKKQARITDEKLIADVKNGHFSRECRDECINLSLELDELKKKSLVPESRQAYEDFKTVICNAGPSAIDVYIVNQLMSVAPLNVAKQLFFFIEEESKHADLRTYSAAIHVALAHEENSWADDILDRAEKAGMANAQTYANFILGIVLQGGLNVANDLFQRIFDNFEIKYSYKKMKKKYYLKVIDPQKQLEASVSGSIWVDYYSRPFQDFRSLSSDCLKLLYVYQKKIGQCAPLDHEEKSFPVTTGPRFFERTDRDSLSPSIDATSSLSVLGNARPLFIETNSSELIGRGFLPHNIDDGEFFSFLDDEADSSLSLDEESDSTLSLDEESDSSSGLNPNAKPYIPFLYNAESPSIESNFSELPDDFLSPDINASAFFYFLDDDESDSSSGLNSNAESFTPSP